MGFHVLDHHDVTMTFHTCTFPISNSASHIYIYCFWHFYTFTQRHFKGAAEYNPSSQSRLYAKIFFFFPARLNDFTF